MKFDSQNLLAVLPLLAGASITVSSAMNSSVGQRLGAPIWGAFMNKVTGFGGAALIVFVFFFMDKMTLPWLAGVKEIGSEINGDWRKCSMLFGFVFDAAYTFTSVTLPLRIGYGTFFVAVVCGQVVMSVVIDLSGWLWNIKKPLNRWKYIGLCLVVFGTVFFRLSGIIHDGASFEYKNSALASVAAIAGAVRVAAACFNRKINSYVKRLMVTGSWIFGATGIFLLVPTLIVEPNPDFHSIPASDFWIFLGFMMSLCSMSVNIIVPPKIGYSANYAWTVCGQLFCSMLLDAVGFLKPDKDPVTATKIVGAATSLVGVLVMQFTFCLPKDEKEADQLGSESSPAELESRADSQAGEDSDSLSDKPEGEEPSKKSGDEAC